MRIAIAGKMGSGKTTLANILIDKYKFNHLSFAKAVKQVGMQEYGLTWEQAFGNEKNREVLQKIGHGKRIEMGDDYWVNKVVEEMNKNPDADYVIDDVRYYNEYKILKQNGFVMVRIESREELRKERLGDKFKNPNHISEIELDGIIPPDPAKPDKESWDVWIINNGSLNSFQDFADSIYKAFAVDTETEPKQDNV